MAIKNKFSKWTLFAGSLLWTTAAGAYELQMNTAKMQAMDKITGRVSVIEVPVNSEVRFGSFSIVVRACKATPPEETPENYAFVDVADADKDGKLHNIFKGWMTSSSPALNAVEHPIYDVWLLQCLNKQSNKKQMSAEELNARDLLPKKDDKGNNGNLSKEALIAAEAEAEAKAAAMEKEIAAKAEEVPAAVSEVLDVQEVKKMTLPAVAVESSDAEPAEEGAPVSLIPVMEAAPAAVTESSNSAPLPAENDVPSQNTEAEALPEEPVVLDNETVTVDTTVETPSPAPLLTEEDILPTVDVSDEENAVEENQFVEPEASVPPEETSEKE